MEDKYVMLVDENGQPYIAHSINLRQTVRNVGNSVRSAGSNAINAARTTASNARSGAGRGVRAVHKYIAKIGEGAQARYFYTQEELRAYQQQAARQAQGMANKAGQTMRNVSNKAGQAMKNAGNSVQNAGRKVVDTVKDKAGVDERQRAEEAWSKVPKQLSSKDEKGMQAFKEANKAQDEYRNTPLGRAEYAAERAKEIATGVDGSARDIAERAGNAVKSKYDRMKDEFKDTANKAKDAAKKSGENLQSTADRMREDLRKMKGKAEKIGNEVEKTFKNVKELGIRGQQYKGDYQPPKGPDNKNETTFDNSKNVTTWDNANIKTYDNVTLSNAEKEHKQLQIDRKAAEKKSKIVDYYFGEVTKLADSYEIQYGEDWKNRMTKEQAADLEDAERKLEAAKKDSEKEWEAYGKKATAYIDKYGWDDKESK